VEDDILKYLSGFTVITKEIKAAISESTIIRSFKKGTVLLREGSVSNECYFILKGCVRSYLLKNGEEKTIEFYTEQQALTPTVYGTSRPSAYYLECLEDTIASVGNPELEKETFQKYPGLASLYGVIAEKAMAQQHDSFAQFKSSTPEERYSNLLNTRPDLIQRVHQHQIASYLGVKPESLSRIRKRIAGKRVS